MVNFYCILSHWLIISNTGKFFYFNNNVSNLYNNSVVEKINGMAFNPTTTLKLIYISPIDCAFQKNVKYSISL